MSSCNPIVKFLKSTLHDKGNMRGTWTIIVIVWRSDLQRELTTSQLSAVAESQTSCVNHAHARSPPSPPFRFSFTFSPSPSLFFSLALPHSAHCRVNLKRDTRRRGSEREDQA